MCTSSVSNVIYHKFSHGAAFYTLNGKNVNVMQELIPFFKQNRSKAILKNLSRYNPNLLIHFLLLACEEVCAVLETLLTGKACGPDQINNMILKEVAYALSPINCPILFFTS